MRRFRLLLPLSLALLALVAAACGGSSSKSSAAADPAAGATIAPASAPVYVSIDTDSSSSQWKQADALLGKFPIRDKLLQKIQSSLRGQGVDFQQDVEPALGNELDIVVLDLQNTSSNVVGMLQPKDKAKLQALLDKIVQKDPTSKAVTAEYKGWTLVAETQATIDKFEAEAAKGALADDTTFKDAMANESGDAVAKAFVNGAAVSGLLQKLGSCQSQGATLTSISASLGAESNGVRLHAAIQTSASGGAPQTSELLSQIPSGALLAIDLHGSPQTSAIFKQLQGCGGQTQKALGQVQNLLGVKAEDLFSLFGKESALYVRSGSPLPEVTFVAQENDTQAALATLDQLAQGIAAFTGAKAQTTTLDGVPAKELQITGGVSIFYAAIKGEVVVTDSRTAIRDLQGGGPKLKDDATFKEAKDASGMPDKTGGFLYVDLRDAIPLVESLAQLGGVKIPADVDANLQPLQTLMLYGAGVSGKTDLTAFLEIK